MTDQRPQMLKVRQICLEHAADLVASAERVLSDNGYPNIAYHLGILALEEIGKAGMISSRAAVGNARDTAWMDRRLEDHVWKIQWAVWSPTLGGQRIDPKEFEEARRFAQSSHARRLAGLYVDPNADDASAVSPRASVTVDHATSIMNLARARLALEEAAGGPVLDEPNEDLNWFLDTMNDERGTSRLFSKPFIDKHEELEGDVRAWIAWARQEFEKIAAEEQAHLQKELARLPSAPETSKARWEVKIRLFTPSHSIRPKVLTYWNKHMGWAKLIAVPSKKNELLLELSLSDAFTVKEIYNVGLSSSKLCIAALNIGSLGFFWYDLPRQTSRYYEQIRDLDAPTMDVNVGSAPGLLGDWNQGALTEKNLQHAIECVAAFGPMADEAAAPIFGHYLQGLVLLSKSDIHLSCEGQARDAFILSLRNAAKHFGDWDGRMDTFIASMHRVFEPIIPVLDHRNQLFDILAPLPQSGEGATADAISAKRLADLYLVLVSDRIVSEKIAQKIPEALRAAEGGSLS
ncbi:AbiV family abortive infection protein [Microbacteriaceae bacterium K1510]|nr:AbiV family abortive infection protein [Microbacteriaceae bacterium K1510]